jgi:Holliday junction resolvase
MNEKFEISSLDLSDIVRNIVSSVSEFDSNKASADNLIDAFAAASEVAIFGHSSYQMWLKSESDRQRQKALMNAVGNAQQELIGKLEGFTSYPPQKNNPMPDVVGVRGSQRVYAEIKNKHNTMNSKSAAATYDTMVKFSNRKEYKDYVGIVVQIISEVPGPNENKWSFFAPGVDRNSRDDLLVMSGRVFYAIATDPLKRQPMKDFNSNEDLTKWESWDAIDLMKEAFLLELEKQTSNKIPDWVKDLFINSIGS